MLKPIFFIYCFIAIINSLYEIVTNIYNKNFFIEKFQTLEKHSLLWDSISCGKLYSLIDIGFDSFYLFFKCKIRLFLCLLILGTGLIFYKILWFFPYIYLISFLSGLLLFFIRYLICCLTGHTHEFSVKNLNINPFGQVFTLVIQAAKLGYYHAFLFIYYCHALRKKKINLHTFDSIIISYLLGCPFWLLKIIYKQSLLLNDFLLGEELKRKSVIAWPTIIFNKIYSNFAFAIYDSYKSIFLLLSTHKIHIKGYKIFLNPFNLEKVMQAWKSLGPNLLNKEGLLTEFVKIDFYGQEHQGIIDPQTKAGVGLTTAHKIYIGKAPEGVGEITTKDLDDYQKFVISKYNADLKLKQGFLESWFTRNNFTNFEEFIGFFIKINFIYKYTPIKEFVYQSNTKDYIIELAHEENPKKVYEYPYQATTKAELIHELKHMSTTPSTDNLIEKVENVSRAEFLETLKHAKNSEVYKICKNLNELEDILKIAQVTYSKTLEITKKNSIGWDELIENTK